MKIILISLTGERDMPFVSNRVCVQMSTFLNKKNKTGEESFSLGCLTLHIGEIKRKRNFPFGKHVFLKVLVRYCCYYVYPPTPNSLCHEHSILYQSVACHGYDLNLLHLTIMIIWYNYFKELIYYFFKYKYKACQRRVIGTLTKKA